MKKLFLLLAVIVSVALGAQAQTKTIRGTVLSAVDDEPLLGATVMPLGGGTGVSTNVDGEFTLNVPVSVKEIKVSYIGMKPATVAVSANMRVVLEPAANMLDNVIVTGYGTGKKLGSVVGAVNIVDDQVFEDTPSSNFVDALQGQVPGLNIFSNTGEPSALPSSVTIRGVSSLSASTTPLYILDGAPVTSAVFTSISPSDIANVTVLKDAASTAIYGSRAANGVIVITTKKGQYGDKAKVSVKASVGFSQRANSKIEIMDSKQYIQFRDMVKAPVSDEIRTLVDRYNINTNWMDELVNNSALMYSLEGRVQGGSEKVRYYLSLGHYDQDGLIARSGIRRETLRASIDSKVNDWFSIGFSGNLGYENYETNSAANHTSNGGVYTNNPFLSAYNLLPYDSPYYYNFDDNGNIIYGDRAEYLHFSGQSDPNFFNRLAWPHSHRTNVSAMLNLYEQITPLKGLTIRTQQALTAFDYRSSAHRPAYGIWETPMGDTVNDWADVPATASESFQRWYQWTYTNTVEYKFNIADKHDFSLLAGQESVIQKNNQFNVSTSGQPSDTQWLLTQGTTVSMSNVGYDLAESTINSWFFNLSYSFNDRYFLDASFRRDGSSKFAPGHRWANFYSVGLMWNIKNEQFLQDVKWLSDLKLRGNYGTTGNSGIGDYAYQGTVDVGSIYDGQSSLGILGQSNHSLTWETVEQLDLGIDFGFLDNRITLMADFYVKNTKDMLMDVPYSYTTGFTSGAANVGSMRNTGVDVDFGATIFRNKDWYVGASVNFNYNKIEIKELFNGLNKFTVPGTGVTYEVGKNPFELHNVKYAGVDPRDGQQMWYTKDGNLTKHYSEDDEVALGKCYIAPWNGGFGLNARWKGLALRADFNWSAQKYIFNATNWYIRDPSQAVERNTNGAVELLNVWTKPGDVTDMPNRFDLYGQPQTIKADDRFVEDASFLRLKNLTLTYSLPQKWMNALRLSDITLHFTGRNLITITDFTGVDPEFQGNAIHTMYPNTRQYEFGLEVTF